MKINNIKDLRDITITKEEYIKLGEINGYTKPKPMVVRAYDSRDNRIRVGDRVMAVISKGKVIEILSETMVVVKWDSNASTKVETDAHANGLTVISEPLTKIVSTLDGRLSLGDRVQIKGKPYIAGVLMDLKFEKYNAEVLWDGGQLSSVSSSSLEARKEL